MVLGAGIVGVCTAIHLRRLGLDVALIDRKHPGAEASSGHAGIVKRNGFAPRTLPGRPQDLLASLFRPSCAFSCDIKTLLRQLPWIRQYQAASSGRGLEAYSRVIAPLRAFAVEEHLELARTTNADRYYRQGGWLHLYRSEAAFRQDEAERLYARVFGVAHDELNESELGKLEPGLKTVNLKAVYWPESHSVSNPDTVVDAFWRTYVQEGGGYFRGDAGKLRRQRGGFTLAGEQGELFARNAVIALGAWSEEVLKGFGESYPLAVQRGYHMHYRPVSGASLSRPVVDVENGCVLTPTDKGIRLTTGVELAGRDTPPNPAIIKLAKRRVEEFFPLGRPMQDEPWMGSRPCLPDSLPVVGASLTVPRLWLNFGHGHDGFTLGPVTGRLLAEKIAGKAPFLDMTGLSPGRFAL